MAETASDSGPTTHSPSLRERSRRAWRLDEDRFRVEALRDYLDGPWRVEREILDRRADLVGSFNGSLTFVPDAGGLRCREAGRMVMGGYSGLAHRDYLFSFPSRRRAEVRFADGRAFHDLDLSTGRWTAAHLCPPDRYEGCFMAQDEDRWLTSWKISGPHKAARLRTIYMREPVHREPAA